MKIVCREFVRTSKAPRSEKNLAAEEFYALLQTAQSILNHAPLKRLGVRNYDCPGANRKLLWVFTGNIPFRPFIKELLLWKYKTLQSQTKLRLRQLCSVEQTQEILQRGCFLGRRAKAPGHKMMFMLVRARRITPWKSKWVYEVEEILHGGRATVHVRQMCLYSDGNGRKRGRLNSDSELSGRLTESQHFIVIHSESTFQTITLSQRFEDHLQLVNISWILYGIDVILLLEH